VLVIGQRGKESAAQAQVDKITRAQVVGHSLRPLRESWARAACRLLENGESAVVRVLIAEVRGSAPREPGTSMLVSQSEIYGSIGGGNLELQAVRAAQALLQAAPAAASVRFPRLVLGRQLGQCCGGVVQLWLERFHREDLQHLLRVALTKSGREAILTEVTSQGVVRHLVSGSNVGTHPRFASTSDSQATLLEPCEKPHPPLWLYGAGHVGQALVHVLGQLPFDVTWIDSRGELFPEALPDNIRSVPSPAPINTLNASPANALFLVMTHDHALDYALCRRILERGDFAWLGLIGSKSKGARFRSRLLRDGLAPELIARLTCPIGIKGVDGKLPAAIAVAVAAQLLRDVGAVAANETRATGSRPAITRPDRTVAAPDPAAVPQAVGAAAPEPANRLGTASLEDTCTSPDCAACAAHGPSGRWPAP
jgi:xanthine dehydrogenase accessory factor